MKFVCKSHIYTDTTVPNIIWPTGLTHPLSLALLKKLIPVKNYVSVIDKLPPLFLQEYSRTLVQKASSRSFHKEHEGEATTISFPHEWNSSLNRTCMSTQVCPTSYKTNYWLSATHLSFSFSWSVLYKLPTSAYVSWTLFTFASLPWRKINL